MHHNFAQISIILVYFSSFLDKFPSNCGCSLNNYDLWPLGIFGQAKMTLRSPSGVIAVARNILKIQYFKFFREKG